MLNSNDSHRKKPSLKKRVDTRYIYLTLLFELTATCNLNHQLR